MVERKESQGTRSWGFRNLIQRGRSLNEKEETKVDRGRSEGNEVMEERRTKGV